MIDRESFLYTILYSESSTEVLELRSRIVELESLVIALMSENSALEAENERLLSKVPGGGGSRNGKASNPLGIKPSVPQTEVILLEFARSETKGFQDVKLQLVNSYVGNILKAGYVPTE